MTIIAGCVAGRVLNEGPRPTIVFLLVFLSCLNNSATVGIPRYYPRQSIITTTLGQIRKSRKEKREKGKK